MSRARLKTRRERHRNRLLPALIDTSESRCRQRPCSRWWESYSNELNHQRDDCRTDWPNRKHVNLAWLGETEQIVDLSGGLRSSTSRRGRRCAQTPERLNLFGVPEQNLQKPDGGITRRRGAALVFLKGSSSAADDPPRFFLGKLQSFADSLHMGRIGCSQRLERFIRCRKITAGVNGVAIVVRIPTRHIDNA